MSEEDIGTSEETYEEDLDYSDDWEDGSEEGLDDWSWDNEEYGYCEHEDREELWEYKEVNKKLKIWRRTCLKCGATEEEILIVEYWEEKFVTILGKQYRALKAWGNISVCSECGEVVWHPIILWDSKDTSKAVTFHHKCAERLGIFELLKESIKEIR